MRFLLLVVLAVLLAVCGATIPLGKRTFFGHVRAIWSTDEAREAREGIQETAEPALERIERAGKKAYEELRRDEAGDASPMPAATR